MSTRHRIATFLILWVVAYGGGSLALVTGAAQAQSSSAGSTYGGQGTQIPLAGTAPSSPATSTTPTSNSTPTSTAPTSNSTPTSTAPTSTTPTSTTPTSTTASVSAKPVSASTSTLPFTGLDLGLLIGAALILIAGGIVLRLRLRHGSQ